MKDFEAHCLTVRGRQSSRAVCMPARGKPLVKRVIRSASAAAHGIDILPAPASWPRPDQDDQESNQPQSSVLHATFLLILTLRAKSGKPSLRRSPHYAPSLWCRSAIGAKSSISWITADVGVRLRQPSQSFMDQPSSCTAIDGRVINCLKQ